MDAIVITDKPPFVNDGVGDYSYNLLNCLKRDGFIVEAICRKGNYEIPSLYHAISGTWGIKSLIILFLSVRNKNPRWILFQYVPYAYSKTGIPVLIPFFLIAARLSGIKVHTNFHEISVRLWNDTPSAIIRGIGQRITAYLISLFANKIQTSNLYYASLLFPFKADIRAIPSNFEPIFETKKCIKKTVPVDNSKIIVANANRCSPLFFKSIERLFQLNLNLKLKIIGRATLSDLVFIETQLKSLQQQNRIEISVNIPAEEYLRTFSEADIYMQLDLVDKNGKGGVSSKSGAIATAFMIGVPIITTKGDLTDSEMFINNDTVLFVPFNSVELVVDAVSQVVGNERLSGKLMQNGRELYETKFSWAYTCSYIKTIIAGC
jgi:glycosyltransferase involved in cell wall biosynthesis